jgi:hypothetical protein
MKKNLLLNIQNNCPSGEDREHILRCQMSRQIDSDIRMFTQLSLIYVLVTQFNQSISLAIQIWEEDWRCESNDRAPALQALSLTINK